MSIHMIRKYFIITIISLLFIGTGSIIANIGPTPQIIEHTSEYYAQQEILRELQLKKKISKYIEANPLIYKDLADQYAGYFIEAANIFHVNVEDLVAIAQIESHFDRMAVSHKNCKGIMQINYKVWKEDLITEGIISNSNDLYDPKLNIYAGAYIFKRYLDEAKAMKYKKPVQYAVMRYVGTSMEYLSNKPSAKTHRYYAKYLDELKVYQKLEIIL